MRLPVVVMACKSTLYSAAMREASGLAAAPGLLADWAAGVTGSPAGVSTCALLVVEIGVVCFGNASPGARIVAMTCPTGTSSPSVAVTLASTPSAGASSSTVALSVSTSTTGSPFLTSSPSALSHCTILPISCAIPSTGKIISVAMIALLSSSLRCLHSVGLGSSHDSRRAIAIGQDIEIGLGFTRGGQGSRGRVIAHASDQQFLSREAGDHLTAILRDD